MGILPVPSDYIIDKKIDATADVISATFESQYSDIKDTVPPNSVVSAFSTHGPFDIRPTESSSAITRVCENGMSDISDSSRGILAVGGPGFNPIPFALVKT